jgi:hypothetical protein
VGAVPQSQAIHTLLVKVAGTSEPSSYVFDQGVDQGRMAGGVVAYSGVDVANPIHAWAASAGNTSTLVAPSVNASVPNTVVLRLWGWRGVSATEPGVGFNVPPAGVTERWSAQTGHANSDRNRVLGGSQEWASTGAVGTSTASGSASSEENRRSAFTVILAPAP